MMGQSSERRKSGRLPVSSVITCYVKAGDISCQGTLQDMSLSGCYIGWDSFIQLSDACEVDLVIHGTNSLLKIEGIAGHIIRSDENGVAIHFNDRMEWFSLLSSYLCNII